MICEICKDEFFLRLPSREATAEDMDIARNLLDTLKGTYMVMFNPVILKKEGAYQTEEGCLSLSGSRRTERFQSVKVQWQNEKFQTRAKTFAGWTAQIIQHEIDHCNGMLI